MRQMKDVRAEIVPLIKRVCISLTGSASDNEVRLLLGTAAAESSLKHRKQMNGGPARGLWQMEPFTGKYITNRYLSRKGDLWNKLIYTWLELDGLDYFPLTVEEVRHHLEYDDFACAMARIHYLRDPDPIPDALEGQAEYWKRVYNTPAGAGTVEHYLSQWIACGCGKLITKG